MGSGGRGARPNLIPRGQHARHGAAHVGRRLPEIARRALDSLRRPNVPVEDAVRVVIAIEEQGERFLHLRGDGRAVLKTWLEIPAGALQAVEGPVGAVQRVTQPAVGRLPELLYFGQRFDARYGYLTLRAAPRWLSCAFKSRRVACASPTSAARVARISSGTAHSTRAAATAIQVNAASSSQTRIC
jgi:hypothetical protein